jgi:hypothetical protein
VPVKERVETVRKYSTVREPLIAAGIVVAAVGGIYLYVLALMYLFARLSGWRTLAARYPGRTPVPSPRKRLGYAVFRGWLGYNGGLIVSADTRGLFISAWAVLLAPCHPPITIPWNEIVAIRRRRILWTTCYGIETRGAPKVDFALRARTFEFVRPQAIRASVPLVES